MCCDRTLSEDWGVLPLGVVSSSGIGDGSYPTYGVKNEKGEFTSGEHYNAVLAYGMKAGQAVLDSRISFDRLFIVGAYKSDWPTINDVERHQEVNILPYYAFVDLDINSSEE